MLIIQANDGWLGNSYGPYQHFELARLRAIENRIPILRSANTGISGVIRPDGTVQSKVGLNKQLIFQENINISKSGSIYSSYGDIFALVCFLITLLIFIIMQKALYVSLLHFSLLLGSPTIHPIVKSLLVPGWGEASLGYQKSSRFFIHSEKILMVGCLSAYKIGDMKRNEYIAFANEHAGAKNISDHRYWVDIGNYNSNQAFDEEHLRMRDGKEGQWSSYLGFGRVVIVIEKDLKK